MFAAPLRHIVCLWTTVGICSNTRLPLLPLAARAHTQQCAGRSDHDTELAAASKDRGPSFGATHVLGWAPDHTEEPGDITDGTRNDETEGC